MANNEYKGWGVRQPASPPPQPPASSGWNSRPGSPPNAALATAVPEAKPASAAIANPHEPNHTASNPAPGKNIRPAFPPNDTTSPLNDEMRRWKLKLAVCIALDAMDMTIGRGLFLIPFSGEIVGAGLCLALFGWKGLLYGLEAGDVSEQLDGFIPTATMIAMANKPR